MRPERSCAIGETQSGVQEPARRREGTARVAVVSVAREFQAGQGNVPVSVARGQRSAQARQGAGQSVRAHGAVGGVSSAGQCRHRAGIGSVQCTRSRRPKVGRAAAWPRPTSASTRRRSAALGGAGEAPAVGRARLGAGVGLELKAALPAVARSRRNGCARQRWSAAQARERQSGVLPVTATDSAARGRYGQAVSQGWGTVGQRRAGLTVAGIAGRDRGAAK